MMSGVDYHVVVLGGGPAGARCAETLAAGGLRPLLVEVGDPLRGKLCGGLLNRRAQDALGMDMPDHVRVSPEFPPLEYHDIDNRLRYRYEPVYRNINRSFLDSWLLDRAAQAGAELSCGTCASGIEAAADGVGIVLDGERVTARHVVDATGWRALSRKCISAARPRRLNCIQSTIRLDPPLDAMWAIYRTVWTPFFSWIIPKGEGRFLVGTGLPPGCTAARPVSRLQSDSQSAAGAWSLLDPILDYLEWRGHRVKLLESKPRGAPLTWIRNVHDLWWGNSLVHPVGEAAGFVSPFSGEGISYALLSADATARAILDDAPDGWIKRAMHPGIRRLKSSCARARIGASPVLRRWAIRLLHYHTGRPVARLPWRSISLFPI